MDRLRNEPVAVVNTIAAFVEAAIVLVIAFGVAVTPEQMAAIIGVVIALGAVIATLTARAKVSPVNDG